MLLDLLRFSAAVLVLIAHATHPEFGAGWKNLQVLGDIAVPIFFVLSGFVIRFVTQTRETTAKVYFIDRASRIYSVVLPAMAFTLIASAACYAIDRNRFVGDGWSETCNHVLLRLTLNLTFLSQAWGHNTIPFLDSPFWSLGYECAYYVLFGILVFARGWSRALGLGLVACVIGPQVLFLLPVWWLGCLVYDAYRVLRRIRFGAVLPAVFGGYLLLALAAAGLGQRSLLRLPAVFFMKIVGLPNPIERLLSMDPRRATMFAVAVGVYAALLLLLLLLAIDRWEWSLPPQSLRHLRRVAEGTFSIYLLHYPMLVLCLFLGLIRPRYDLTNVLTIVLVCGLLVLAAGPMESFKGYLRRHLRALLP